jgi:cystathionine beta-lyase
MEHDELRSFFLDDARVGLNDGAAFGPEGKGFMRLNAACPRVILEEALVRIEKAVKVLRKR